jgi:hypothetical protein
MSFSLKEPSVEEATEPEAVAEDENAKAARDLFRAASAMLNASRCRFETWSQSYGFWFLQLQRQICSRLQRVSK